MAEQKLSEAEWQAVANSISLQDSPGHLFRVLEYRIHERYFQLTERPDVSPRQAAALLKLFQVGEATQTELARMINLDRSTLSEMSSRMTARGLLGRRVPEHDRRATTLYLTEEGKQALFDTIGPSRQAQSELMDKLPDELRPLFIKCLMILYDASAPDDSATPAEDEPEVAKPRKRAAAASAKAQAAMNGRAAKKVRSK